MPSINGGWTIALCPINCPDLDWEERKLNADQEPPNYVEKDDWNSRLHSFIHINIKLSLCSLLLIILNI